MKDWGEEEFQPLDFSPQPGQLRGAAPYHSPTGRTPSASPRCRAETRPPGFEDESRRAKWFISSRGIAVRCKSSGPPVRPGGCPLICKRGGWVSVLTSFPLDRDRVAQGTGGQLGRNWL